MKANLKDREFDCVMKDYVELAKWREKGMKTVSTNHQDLNMFHDNLMRKAVYLAIEKMISEWGNPPAHFDFFIMGSAARFEQSIWSDQDHGIIYEGTDELQPYFLTLGSEIARAFSIVGYELCDGNVMASNTLWCQSVRSWKEQILLWLEEESLKSLRYFSTFFDSRVLVGTPTNLNNLKQTAFSKLDELPSLYTRLVENVENLNKGIGPFGQLLIKSSGVETGTLNIKETVLFPYVNSLRLLALKEKITQPSTSSRFKYLPASYHLIKDFESDFTNLLNYRLSFQKNAENYKTIHLLKVENLSKTEKSELKRIMNNGYKLFSKTKVIIEKGVHHDYESNDPLR